MAQHGLALLVVDQPATIGALPVAVAQSLEGVEVAYLPGLTMRRVADLHGGNKRLKSALFNSAFASLDREPSRRYYDKKRDEKKTHKQAVIALARRRLDNLYAMLRDGTFYDDPTAPMSTKHFSEAA